MEEPVTLFDPKSIVTDEILGISQVLELTNQLDKTKDDCGSRTQQYEKKVFCLKEKAFQDEAMQQVPADTLEDASIVVVSLAAFLEKACDEFCG